MIIMEQAPPFIPAGPRPCLLASLALSSPVAPGVDKSSPSQHPTGAARRPRPYPLSPQAEKARCWFPVEEKKEEGVEKPGPLTLCRPNSSWGQDCVEGNFVNRKYLVLKHPFPNCTSAHRWGILQPSPHFAR